MNKTFAYYIAVLYKDFIDYSTSEFKALGFNFGQFPFILYVGKHPNCTQAKLTSSLHLDWGHSSRTITKLVENGFMTKELVDNKNYCLSLTDKGYKAFKLTHDVFESWDQQHLSSLSEEERTTLLLLNEKVLETKSN